MKNTYLSIAALVLVATALQAQENQKEEYGDFKKRTYAGLGGGVVHSAFPSNGMLIDLEVSYRFAAPFTLGLRWDVYAGAVFGPDGSPDDFLYRPIFRTSLSLVTNYYLSKKRFKPYLGCGVGMYILSPAEKRRIGTKTGSFGGGDAVTEKEFRPGISPRVGFQWAEIDIALECHLMASSQMKIVDGNGQVNNNLLCVRLNFLVGPAVQRFNR